MNVDHDSDLRLRDPAACVDRLTEGIRAAVRSLGRRGVVVGVSGGVDSGVTAALCVRALGPANVLCLRMPERDVGDASSALGAQLAEQLGCASVEEPITAALEGLGCYRRRDDAIRAVFEGYEPSWKHKLVRSPVGGVIVFSLVVERPDGTQETRRMPAGPYRALLAATNMKQRVRKLMEYTWADQLGHAVAGTPNLLEHDQGFFVKGGDGLADVKPIAGLYKQQVFELADWLGLPAGIAGRLPTTETFSLPQTQEEFYFGHPYERMDLLVWAERRDADPASVAAAAGMEPDAVAESLREIKRRREATAYLHAPAVVLD